MFVGRIFDILGAIVGVALAATFLASANTAAIITALANGFSNSVKTAQGRG